MLHHLVLALVAVLLPILVIEGPLLSNKIDMGISGTYDVLLLSFLLPKEQVLQLLPPSMQGNVLPVPAEVLSSLSASDEQTSSETHPVLLQMGYQISTGPGPSWLPKFSFNECKLEVPFVSHPSGKSKTTFTFKQSMIFSNLVIKMGSSATGLHSLTAQFSPPNTPSHAAKEERHIKYSAAGFVDATATKAAELSSSSSWGIYRDMMESWWFGSGTGEVVQKFNFDWESAAITPEPYHMQVQVDLAAFVGGESSLPKVTAKGLGWRTRVSVASIASKAGQEEINPS